MKRLLVVRLSALGDVIHAIPAVAALRDHFEIDWVVESQYRELVETVAQVTAKPVSLKRWSVKKIREAQRAVAGHEIAIDFQGLIKSALLARASGAADRYGFASQFIREKPAAWLINRHVEVDPSTHVVEWNLRLAQALLAECGNRLQPSRPAEAGPHTAGDFSRFATASSFAGRIVLIPGAGRPEKQWPVERFRDLARRIGSAALVVWGPSEQPLAEAVGAELAPPTNLRELAGVLRDAQLVIGGDTGPLHLAAALGTKVVGLYGPTSPARNGPYGQLGGCVSTFATTRSMLTIEVDDVFARLTPRVVGGR